MAEIRVIAPRPDDSEVAAAADERAANASCDENIGKFEQTSDQIIHLNTGGKVRTLRRPWCLGNEVVPTVTTHDTECLSLKKNWSRNRELLKLFTGKAFPEKHHNTYYSVLPPCEVACDIIKFIKDQRGKPTRAMRRVARDGQPTDGWITMEYPGQCCVRVLDDTSAAVIALDSTNLGFIMTSLANEADAILQVCRAAIESRHHKTKKADMAQSESESESMGRDDDDEPCEMTISKAKTYLPRGVFFAKERQSFMATPPSNVPGVPRKEFHVRAKAPSAVEETWHQRKRAIQYHADGTILEPVQLPISKKANIARRNTEDIDAEAAVGADGGV